MANKLTETPKGPAHRALIAAILALASSCNTPQSSNADKQIDTPELATSTINGTEVTLPPDAMEALEKADEELRRETGEGIQFKPTYRSNLEQAKLYDSIQKMPASEQPEKPAEKPVVDTYMYFNYNGETLTIQDGNKSSVEPLRETEDSNSNVGIMKPGKSEHHVGISYPVPKEKMEVEKISIHGEEYMVPHAIVYEILVQIGYRRATGAGTTEIAYTGPDGKEMSLTITKDTYKHLEK